MLEGSTQPRGRQGRFGLRGRIVIRFASIALLLSLTLGLVTYLTVRQIVVENREESAIDQVARDALLLEAVGPDSTNPSELLASMRPPSRSTPLFLAEGRWFAASLQVRPEDLPQDLVETVVSGVSARQFTRLGPSPVLVVGTPLRADLGAYFEVFRLDDIEATLSALLTVLMIAGLGTTIAGALLGWIMAGRVLQPLHQVAGVAQQIAAGELESRIDETLDRDLLTLTSSFNRMADALQERIAREARFASDVAHELRTPVTTLVTSLSVIERRRDELTPQGREALDLLSRDVRRLERTVADLIEIAKHDAGVATVDLEPVPVATLLGWLLNRLRRPDIPVDIDEPATRSTVLVDQMRLERVLANLIDNAESYAGGVDRLSVEGRRDAVLIAVEDSGPGIPIEERERIFERFARGQDAPRTGQYEGSGLGLSLAQENARLQGGLVRIEGRPGGGARFVVEVPVVEL